MQHRFTAALATIALTLTIIFSGAIFAGPANALPAANKIYLNGGSTGNVRVYGDIRVGNRIQGYRVEKGYRWLAPGQNTGTNGAGMFNAINFVAPRGCVTYKVTGILTKKYTIMHAGWTHYVYSNTTLLIYC